MHDHSAGLSSGLQSGLAFYYFLVFLLNVGFVAYWRSRRNPVQMLIWSAVAALFLVLACAYAFGAEWVIPHGVRDFFNGLMNAVSYFVMAVIGFIVFLRFRRFLTQPAVAWTILMLALLFGGWAMTDPHFGGQDVMGKADN